MRAPLGEKKSKNPRVLKNLRKMLLITVFILDLHKFVLDSKFHVNLKLKIETGASGFVYL